MNETMAMMLEDQQANKDKKLETSSDERTKKVLKEGKRHRSLVQRTRINALRTLKIPI